MSPLLLPSGGDQDRGGSLLAITWAETFICIVVLGLRFYSRMKLKNIGIDDWMMLITLILFIAGNSLATLAITHGLGRHLVYLTPSEITYAVKFTWILQPFWIVAFGTGKMSVAFLLLRLLGPSAFWRKCFLRVNIFLTFISNALAALFTFIQCNPPRALWEGPQNIPGARCWNPSSQSDYLIYVGAGISSAIKTSNIRELDARGDLTWKPYNLYVWSVAEIFLTIICGSVPTLKPIYDLIRGYGHLSLSVFSPRKSDISHISSGGSRARKRSYHKHLNPIPDNDIVGAGSGNRSRGCFTKATAGSSNVPPRNSEDGTSLVELGHINVKTQIDTEYEPQDNENDPGQGSRRDQRPLDRRENDRRDDASLDLGRRMGGDEDIVCDGGDCGVHKKAD